MANTFDWIEIRTSEIGKLADFYRNIFGWEIIAKEIADGSEVWIFDTRGEPRSENLRRGGIWLRSPEQVQGVIVYIVVEDIGSALARVLEFGGEVLGEKIEAGAGFLALIADPCGNHFGLYQDR